MNVFKFLILLIPVITTAYGQSSVSIGVSISTSPTVRRSSISAPEGETINVCLNPFPAPTSDSTFSVESEDGTATASDYSRVSTTLTLRAGDRTQQCTSVTLTADEDDDEPDEYFLIVAEGAGAFFNVRAIFNITITGVGDGDGGDGGTMAPIGITLESASYTVFEAEGSVEVCAIQNGDFGLSTVAVLRTVEVSSSTAATEGSDYTGVSDVVTFDGPGSRHCIDVPIIADEVDEGNEEFQVELTSNLFGMAFLMPITTATVVIRDGAPPPSPTPTPTPDVAMPTPTPTPDVATPTPTPSPTPSPLPEDVITLESTSYTVSEADGNVVVCAVQNVQIDGDIAAVLRTVELSSSNAATEGSDYTMVAQVVVFDGLGSRQCISIPIIADRVKEGDEEFQVQLNTNDVAMRVIGPIGAATVVITDVAVPPSPTPTPTPTPDVTTPMPTPTPTPDVTTPTPTPSPSPTTPPLPEDASAYIELSSYLVSETAGYVEVCVIVKGQLNSIAIVTLTTHPLTATSPDDYTDVNEDLEFGPIMNDCDLTCIRIPIVNEDREIFEPDEYFYVLLSTTDPRITIGGFYAIVAIQNAASTDPSRPYAALEFRGYVVTEDQTEVEVCAVLSADLSIFQYVFGSLQTLSAPAVPPAQAIPTVDFDLGFQYVYFRPGQPAGSRVCMTVSINRNSEEQCAKVFRVKYFDYTFLTKHWPTTALVRILN